MRSTLALLKQIADMLRRKNDRPMEVEYLGYESYPSSQTALVNVSPNSSLANVKHRRAA